MILPARILQKESECVWCMRVLKVAAGGNFGRREGSIKRGVSERGARGQHTGHSLRLWWVRHAEGPGRRLTPYLHCIYISLSTLEKSEFSENLFYLRWPSYTPLAGPTTQFEEG